MGQLIPGGTGFPMHRNIKLVPLAEPHPENEDLEVEDSEEAAAIEEAQKALQDFLG